MPFGLARPNVKTATYAVRAIQIIFSVTISAIFVRLLAKPYWATPKSEIAVLLAFVSFYHFLDPTRDNRLPVTRRS
jgi:hypothetical protein